MDVISNLGLGFSVALTIQNVAYCFIGALLGTLIGVLPGIGPVTTVAMLLPISFTLPPESAMILLAGIYYGAQYGGSTTAILVNIPGEASSVVTTIDGHAMARQGRAGPALGIAALGSFFAGCAATLLIALAAPPLATIALQFGPAEYFSLMVCGLIAAVVLARGSLLKAIAMVVLGLLLGLVGTDVNSGARRFNFGMTGLADGIEFVAISMAIYGIAEVVYNLEQRQAAKMVTGALGRVWPSFADVKQCAGSILRGTGLGAILGVLPGGGALLASFAAYTVEKKVASAPRQFGRRDPLIGIWVRLLRVPYRLLYPFIIVFCCIGAYTINNKAFDVFVMSFFAIFGYVALKLECEPAPLILGFVLGPMMEENLRRALLISRGDTMVFLQEPISFAFLVLAAGLLVVMAVPAIRIRREEALKE
jgi:putative tricarboxylic transport membrane protein